MNEDVQLKKQKLNLLAGSIGGIIKRHIEDERIQKERGEAIVLEEKQKREEILKAIRKTEAEIETLKDKEKRTIGNNVTELNRLKPENLVRFDIELNNAKIEYDSLEAIIGLERAINYLKIDYNNYDEETKLKEQETVQTEVINALAASEQQYNSKIAEINTRRAAQVEVNRIKTGLAEIRKKFTSNKTVIAVTKLLANLYNQIRPYGDDPNFDEIRDRLLSIKRGLTQYNEYKEQIFNVPENTGPVEFKEIEEKYRNIFNFPNVWLHQLTTEIQRNINNLLYRYAAGFRLLRNELEKSENVFKKDDTIDEHNKIGILLKTLETLIASLSNVPEQIRIEHESIKSQYEDINIPSLEGIHETLFLLGEGKQNVSIIGTEYKNLLAQINTNLKLLKIKIEALEKEVNSELAKLTIIKQINSLIDAEKQKIDELNKELDIAKIDKIAKIVELKRQLGSSSDYNSLITERTDLIAELNGLSMRLDNVDRADAEEGSEFHDSQLEEEEEEEGSEFQSVGPEQNKEASLATLMTINTDISVFQRKVDAFIAKIESESKILETRLKTVQNNEGKLNETVDKLAKISPPDEYIASVKPSKPEIELGILLTDYIKKLLPPPPPLPPLPPGEAEGSLPPLPPGEAGNPSPSPLPPPTYEKLNKADNTVATLIEIGKKLLELKDEGKSAKKKYELITYLKKLVEEENPSSSTGGEGVGAGGGAGGEDQGEDQGAGGEDQGADQGAGGGAGGGEAGGGEGFSQIFINGLEKIIEDMLEEESTLVEIAVRALAANKKATSEELVEIAVKSLYPNIRKTVLELGLEVIQKDKEKEQNLAELALDIIKKDKEKEQNLIDLSLEIIKKDKEKEQNLVELGLEIIQEEKEKDQKLVDMGLEIIQKEKEKEWNMLDMGLEIIKKEKEKEQNMLGLGLEIIQKEKEKEKTLVELALETIKQMIKLKKAAEPAQELIIQKMAERALKTSKSVLSNLQTIFKNKVKRLLQKPIPPPEFELNNQLLKTTILASKLAPIRNDIGDLRSIVVASKLLNEVPVNEVPYADENIDRLKSMILVSKPKMDEQLKAVLLASKLGETRISNDVLKKILLFIALQKSEGPKSFYIERLELIKNLNILLRIINQYNIIDGKQELSNKETLALIKDILDSLPAEYTSGLEVRKEEKKTVTFAEEKVESKKEETTSLAVTPPVEEISKIAIERPKAKQERPEITTSDAKKKGKPKKPDEVQVEEVKGDKLQGEAEGEEKGDKAEGEVKGDKAEGEVKGDKAEGEVKGDKAEGEVKGDKAEGEEKGDKAEGEVKGDKAEGEEKGDKLQGESEGEVKAPVVAEGEVKAPAVAEGEEKGDKLQGESEGEVKAPAVAEGEVKAPVVAEGEVKAPVVAEGEVKAPAVAEGEVKVPVLDEGEAPVVAEEKPEIKGGGKEQDNKSFIKRFYANIITILQPISVSKLDIQLKLKRYIHDFITYCMNNNMAGSYKSIETEEKLSYIETELRVIPKKGTEPEEQCGLSDENISKNIQIARNENNEAETEPVYTSECNESPSPNEKLIGKVGNKCLYYDIHTNKVRESVL